MRRTLSLVLAFALMLTLAACGSSSGQGDTGSKPAPEENTPASAAPEPPPANQPEDTAPPEDETPAEPENDNSGNKILIAYFSATNNTENIANHLLEILEADLYEIVPETLYTSDDLDYNTDCRANQEQNDASARPAISGSVDNMEQYDVIFLG